MMYLLLTLATLAAPEASKDFLVCSHALNHRTTYLGPPKVMARAFKTCREIAKEALEQGVDPYFVLALAYKESRWQHGKVGSAGEVGPLQILPQYWCPKKGCGTKTVKYGVKAVRVLLKQHQTEYRAACHYKGGNVCGPKASQSAHRVRRRTLAFRRSRTRAEKALRHL
jgi:hypothetical protein